MQWWKHNIFKERHYFKYSLAHDGHKWRRGMLLKQAGAEPVQALFKLGFCLTWIRDDVKNTQREGGYAKRNEWCIKNQPSGDGALTHCLQHHTPSKSKINCVSPLLMCLIKRLFKWRIIISYRVIIRDCKLQITYCLLKFFGNWISKCPNVMMKRTFVPADRLLLSLSNKRFIIYSLLWSPCNDRFIGVRWNYFQPFLIFDTAYCICS